ncbi:efflux RND transporter permease subunit [Cellulomonas sp. DKR-3]|uniref:Efflux RND transporter permease subunit n=1 Tax=Cellulomonas fulva TaxID=2835530 RepID=A0ABS5TZH4_9CELL|nr:efflux RND transporter permease subunit [Cellulomonas fulva]MBT0994497.1 efflux RND transporter permease subunit [Cellulomonas fulva]
MHRLAHFSLGHRALTALVTVAIAVLGVVSLGGLRQELIPSISFPAAAVVGVYPGASPEVVEQQVTEVVESAVLGVDGIEQVTSTSSSNVSATTIMFEYGTNITTAVADLRGAVESASSQLPDEVDPQVVAGSLDDLPVVQLAVSGGSDEAALATAVDDVLVPVLEDLDDVRSVAVTGAPERQVTLDVDMAALVGAGLTPEAVTSVLDDNGVRVPAGTVTDGDQTLSVQVGTPLTSVDELAALPLTTSTGDVVRLDSVAEVVDGDAEPTSFSRLDGEPSLAVAITKTPDGNVVEVSDDVTAALDEVADRLAAQDVTVTVVFDQAPFITESIEGLATEGGLGLLFAVVVILLFLASWRSTAVSAVSIPLSLLVAFTVMNLTGYTLNLLTLAALTIAIGRVVDDSIVVIENISRHLTYGEDRRAAVLGAVKEVGGAITASTLATVAVFAPIGFVGGFVGELFRPFAFTVAIAMGASLFVALTIVPVLAYWFLKAPAVEDLEAARRTREAAEAKERRGLWQRAYLPVLGASLRRPFVALGVAVAVLAGTVALVPHLETNLIGDSGQDTLTVTADFEPGTSLEAQDGSARTIEQALMGLDDVATVQTSVGSGDAMTAFLSGGGTSATFALTLDEDADGTAAADEVRSTVDALVEEPVTAIDVSAGATGFGSSTVDLVVTADDTDVLAEAATAVEDAAREAPGASAVASSQSTEQPVIQVTVDREAAAAAGLTETAVAGTVAGLMTDPEIGTVDLDGAPVTVTASFGDGPASVEELRAVPLTGPGGTVTLDDVADVEEVRSPASITRSDGRRTVTVSVTPASQDVGSLSADLTQRMDALDLPTGADVTVAGVAADQADAFSDLGLALVLAIAIVYIVLVATFGSLAQPLILLVSIPFAATGALAGLLLTGTPLGVPALIGMLMLVGIVVSNAVVLIDLINQYRARGRALEEAVTEGARKRLRPIVMTAAATIFALLPMAFGITGGGAFISQPLAVVVIGGLITSTLLTLVIVPVIYVLGERRKERRAARRAARRRTGGADEQGQGREHGEPGTPQTAG